MDVMSSLFDSVVILVVGLAIRFLLAAALIGGLVLVLAPFVLIGQGIEWAVDRLHRRSVR